MNKTTLFFEVIWIEIDSLKFNGNIYLFFKLFMSVPLFRPIHICYTYVVI